MVFGKYSAQIDGDFGIDFAPAGAAPAGLN
jgi:hypothetical protein